MITDKAAEEIFSRMSKAVTPQESIDFMLFTATRIRQELTKLRRK